MPTNTGGASGPPSLEKRLPLALALMMLVLLVSQYIFKPAPGPKPVAPVNNKAAATLTEKPAANATTETPAAVAQPAPTGAIQATSATTTAIDTDVYRVEFTNKGAVVKSWLLKKYRDNNNKPLQLVHLDDKGNPLNLSDGNPCPLPFALETVNQKLSVDPNNVLYRARVAPNGLGVDYTYSSGNVTVHKSFLFLKNSYLVDVKSQVLENNNPVPALLMWRGGFGDFAVRGATGYEHTIWYDTAANKLITKSAKDAKNGPVTDTGAYAFGGVEDNFFTAVALPADNSSLQVRTYNDELKVPGEQKPTAFVGTGISSGAQNNLSMFLGPKDIDILRNVNPKLTQVVSWGFFGVIARPLFLWLNWVHDHWTNNYGWAIILVTLIINLALFPLRLSSLKSARKMQRLQPQIKAINDKYKNIKINDPRKAEQNQEVMDLYKREGVNPVGGCLPMIIQLPFFYAFYQVLKIAIELRHAPWMWVPDLSSPETLPIHLLPIILIATQFLTQRLTPAAGVDSNQQRMMMMMPLVFGFMFYYASAGLVLYWLTGNVVGIAQQLIINRFMPTPQPPTPPPAASKVPVKRTGKK
ncbi:MAG TPA: membrane protein insertase YidC [Bryobacteraceae bacterium]|nr:membrane protein insertase YidC [Bryobacteraceae bacterium]